MCSSDLLNPEEAKPLLPQISALRRDAVEVEATPEAVLQTLQEIQSRWEKA